MSSVFYVIRLSTRFDLFSMWQQYGLWRLSRMHAEAPAILRQTYGRGTISSVGMDVSAWAV